jgi:hypothetical protein
MIVKKSVSLFLVFAFLYSSAFADYTITQRRTIDGSSMEVTIQAKGVRVRRSNKISFGPEDKADEDDPMIKQIMSEMMPTLTYITQCDLKQDLIVNDSKRTYFIEYHDWSSVPPEKLALRPRKKIQVRGTVTFNTSIEDSGKRKQMFGLNARWLKYTVDTVFSADSCEGAKTHKMVQEGWFIDLTLESKGCDPPPMPEGEDSGCRPRPIYKNMQSPGLMLEGTTTGYENGKKMMSDKIETVELSKATLDQALFEIPKGYNEADSFSELIRGISGPVDNTAVTRVSRNASDDGKAKTVKTIAIDFFSGSTSKVDQQQLRELISDRLTSAGMAGYLVASQAELTTGNFKNIIAVDVKRTKESGGAKIGGLFGRVTGTPDASKLGDSEAEIVITVLAQDGKTIVATSSANEKAKGSVNDAVRAAIEKALPSVLPKLK